MVGSRRRGFSILNLSLTQKGLLLVSVPLVFEVGFVVYLWGIVEKGDLEISRQEHARSILEHMNALTRKIVDAGTTAGSYSCPVFLGNYSDSLAKTTDEFKSLEGLTKDYPEEYRIVQQVELLAEEGRSLVSQGRSLLRQGQVEAANELLVKSLKPLVGRLNAESDLLTNHARTEEINGPLQRAKMQEQVRRTLIGGIALNIMVALSLAVFFMKNMVRKVERVMDNTFKLARREPLNPPLEGTDEIAHLDRVLRDMAQALDTSSRKERAIFQNARDMICTIANGGLFSNVSPACGEILGYTPQELEGKWFVELVEEGEVNKTIELFKRLFAGECEQPFETRLKRKDGKLIHLLWSAQWSEAESCLFCVAHEITERKVAEELLKASEARVRLILEATPVGIISVNEDGAIQTGNPAVGAMFGVPQENISARTITDVFKLTGSKTASEWLEENIDKSVRLDGKNAAGHLFPAEVTVRQFEAVSGRQFLIVIVDISERLEVERMKQDFIAMVSHELRTPLTSVQGFLDLLGIGGYGDISDAAKNKCTVATRNVSRLIDLINDILDAEKLESGKFDFRFSDVSMKSVIERSVDAVRDFAEKSQVTVVVEPGDAKTIADHDRLMQVVINLISNAVKFSPSGGAVTISVKEMPKYLEVSICDQGAGIPEDYKQIIFERFGQVRGAKSRHKGSGLGLTICKKIVEQHNGQIGVDSVEGEGSRFWFRLPKVMTTATI
jgi:PAS domain S-box-containing protein